MLPSEKYRGYRSYRKLIKSGIKKKKVKDTPHVACDSVETRQKNASYSEFPQPEP